MLAPLKAEQASLKAIRHMAKCLGPEPYWMPRGAAKSWFQKKQEATEDLPRAAEKIATLLYLAL